MASLCIASKSKGCGWVVAACVTETVGTAQGKLILLSELTHRLSQHSHLVGIALPDKVLVPLLPDLHLELLLCLLFVDLVHSDGLLAYEVVMQVTILERLLFVFLIFAKHWSHRPVVCLVS